MSDFQPCLGDALFLEEVLLYTHKIEINWHLKK